MEIVNVPIGFVKSPYKNLVGLPIQPSAGENVEENINLFPE